MLMNGSSHNLKPLLTVNPKSLVTLLSRTNIRERKIFIQGVEQKIDDIFHPNILHETINLANG